MDRLLGLSVVLCVLIFGGCDHIEGAAEAAAEGVPADGAAPGEILGMVSDSEVIRDGFVRLGERGPTVPLTEEGFFTFSDVAPGCYDVHLYEGGRESLSLGAAAACVEAGRPLVLSIVFGRP